MVIRCEVCKKIRKIHPGLSFHIFPKNNARKLMWFSLLGITDSKALKNRAVVCSDHFNRSDFFTKNERQYLKPDALPLPFMSPFIQPRYSPSSETSSCSTSSGKSLSKPRDMRNEYDEVKLGTLSRTSSSSTLTASETDIPNPKYDIIFGSPVEEYQM
ncbi:uncharacterized protein LOC115885101 [Sitophilus oryzae]|uniref:Uncharacterized protein LOC115885101 n=1 Tax=Sitophilus oryzae TaxID=7048 RepID=A0A6J2Y7E7_SITOR|nr:uncharacterized protein LOC115885101 [Sitophilus oryzae]